MKTITIIFFTFCMIGFAVSHFQNNLQDSLFWGILAIVNRISLIAIEEKQ